MVTAPHHILLFFRTIISCILIIYNYSMKIKPSNYSLIPSRRKLKRSHPRKKGPGGLKANSRNVLSVPTENAKNNMHQNWH